jgi:hypothetical protein
MEKNRKSTKKLKKVEIVRLTVSFLYIQSLKLRRIALALNGKARKIGTREKSHFKEFIENLFCPIKC